MVDVTLEDWPARPASRSPTWPPARHHLHRHLHDHPGRPRRRLGPQHRLRRRRRVSDEDLRPTTTCRAPDPRPRHRQDEHRRTSLRHAVGDVDRLHVHGHQHRQRDAPRRRRHRRADRRGARRLRRARPAPGGRPGRPGEHDRLHRAPTRSPRPTSTPGIGHQHRLASVTAEGPARRSLRRPTTCRGQPDARPRHRQDLRPSRPTTRSATSSHYTVTATNSGNVTPPRRRRHRRDGRRDARGLAAAAGRPGRQPGPRREHRLHRHVHDHPGRPRRRLGAQHRLRRQRRDAPRPATTYDVPGEPDPRPRHHQDLRASRPTTPSATSSTTRSRPPTAATSRSTTSSSPTRWSTWRSRTGCLPGRPGGRLAPGEQHRLHGHLHDHPGRPRRRLVLNTACVETARGRGRGLRRPRRAGQPAAHPRRRQDRGRPAGRHQGRRRGLHVHGDEHVQHHRGHRLARGRRLRHPLRRRGLPGRHRPATRRVVQLRGDLLRQARQGPWPTHRRTPIPTSNVFEACILRPPTTAGGRSSTDPACAEDDATVGFIGGSGVAAPATSRRPTRSSRPASARAATAGVLDGCRDLDPLGASSTAMLTLSGAWVIRRQRFARPA